MDSGKWRARVVLQMKMALHRLWRAMMLCHMMVTVRTNVPEGAVILYVSSNPLCKT
jgi:hypothetical protein